MKFSIFLVITLAIQNSVLCRSTADQKVSIEAKSFDGVISTLNAMISQLVASVQYAWENVVSQTQSWIQNEINQIEDAIVNGRNAFLQYVQQVEAELDSLINDQVRPCLADVPDKIKTVRNETELAVEQCRETGRSHLAAIEEDVVKYREVNQAAIEGVFAYIQSCANQPNPGDKIKCAVDAARNISSTVEVVRENIANTSKTVSATIRSVILDTHECIACELRIGREKVQEILEEARNCLEEAASSTASTTSVENSAGSLVSAAKKMSNKQVESVKASLNENAYLEGKTFDIFG